MNELLEPGMWVCHPQAPEWGNGQVQSRVGHRITVNFEHAGKRVIDGRRVTLEWANEITVQTQFREG